jgi:hypothetical protein
MAVGANGANGVQIWCCSGASVKDDACEDQAAFFFLDLVKGA